METTFESVCLTQTDGLNSYVEKMLEMLGEDVTREGLLDTPKRHAKAMRFLTSGYDADIQAIVGQALFKAEANDLVIVRDIEFFSLCEHHLLPFWGKIHVAYFPGEKIIGLSKIPRIIEAFARRLQVQERLTSQVSETLMNLLGARGVGVVIEASHMCMMMRGVQKQSSSTVTSSMLGAFKNNSEDRQELLSLIGRRGVN